MSSPAVFPPLRLRPAPPTAIKSSSTSGLRNHSVMPHAAFPMASDREDNTEDAERRNATALTIVELLARAGTSNNSNNGAKPATQPTAQTSVPALRPLRSGTSNSNSSPLPSLPKMVIPSPPQQSLSSLRPGEQRWPFSNGTAGMLQNHLAFTTTPTATGVSPVGVSPATRPPPAPVSGSCGPSPAKKSKTSANGAPGTVNNSRKRQKDELAKLRAQVQELQRELEHVRARLPRKSRGVGATGVKVEVAQQAAQHPEQQRSPVAVAAAPTMGSEATADSGNPSMVMVVPVWERMAQHQKEEKSKAEMENLRLKGLIQEQLKISKGLEKLLKKRCKSSSSGTESGDAAACALLLGTKEPQTSDAEEAAIFTSLAAGLDARLAEMDTVFEKSGLTCDKRELQETQMILDERRGPVMEVKDAKILPFDVQACSSAVWRCLEAESEASVVGGAAQDTLCFKTPLPLRQHRAPDVELTVRCVVRRVEDRARGRVILLWESVAECPSRLPHMSSSAKGVEVRDCGWGLLEPLACPAGEHSSIMQLCSYLMPQLCGASAEQSRQHIHGLAELVGPCYRSLWTKRQRNVENMLMNSAIGSKSNNAVLKVEFKQETR
ncbi:hypothetical protein BBJ28_00008600 [Nothophytophthora sp. Chile5]|nr:hypothetical protein BBJ28_00008600 [Nothophytophthora sp. Chile5]